MIDLHAHILYGLDDGPESASESMRMAKAYTTHGYHTVAATPHMVPGTAWMPTAERVTTQVADLNRAIRDQGLSLTVVAGMEIALDPSIPDLIDAGRLLPLGKAACLLIEPPFQQLPPGWEQTVFAILARGYAVLLAHPERCRQLGTDMDKLGRLVHSGVYLQVNWGSLLGQYGRTVATAARTILQAGLAHCRATDSHHPGRPDLGRLDDAAAALAKTIGQPNVALIARENPARVLRGEPPAAMYRPTAPTPPDKRPWWRWWRPQ
jgi:protein-tyrosine phosphatase